MGRWLTLVLVGTIGCASATPTPQQLSLAQLIDLATAGRPFLAGTSAASTIPLSAIVTPPGLEIFYDSPPFTSMATSNTTGAPRLNLLPALVAGRFVPFVTVEMWTNDYGPVWYNPYYVIAEADGQGGYVTQPGQYLPSITPPVITVAPPDDFYSPFWQYVYVLVPPAEVTGVQAHPPTSTRDVLDLPWPQVNGALAIDSVVPQRLSFDPPSGRARGTAPDGFSPWMSLILSNEYSAASLSQLSTLSVGSKPVWWEGHSLWTLPLGINTFEATASDVVDRNPLYVWVTQTRDGPLVPADLPIVMSNGPLPAAGASPPSSAFWEINYAVIPAAAAPFYPQVSDPEDDFQTDVFGAVRTRFGLSPPSSAVNTIPSIARYAGRVALNPSCFVDDAAVVGALPAGSSQAAAWASTCGFLDSAAALTAAVPQVDIVDQNTAILAPIQLWAEPQP